MRSSSPDFVGLVVAVLVTGLYLWGVRRAGKWPLLNTAAFLVLGVGSQVAVAVLAPERFSVYAVELMALLLVVPFLMALGRPLKLALAALPERGAERLRTILDSKPARVFTMPIVGPVLLAVLPFGVFFTGLLPESMRHPVVLSLVHLVLLVIGVAVLVPLWEAQSLDTRVPYVLALLVAFIELLADALPGIIIRLDTHVLGAGEFLISNPLRDQQIGGDLLWGLGEVIDLPFLVLLLVQWVRSDARDARAVDEALDARRTEPAPSEVAPTWDRPWWETDASVFGNRAAHFGDQLSQPATAPEERSRRPDSARKDAPGK